jgi:hypothetical protein
MPTGCLALPRACRRLPALLGLLALSGCQLLPGGDFVPGGIGRVDILAPQVIAPASARAWYQGGERVAVVDEYAPHCELEVNTVSPSERVVRPGRFAVVGGGTAVLSDPNARLPLYGPFADVACSDAVYYEVEYRLASETQPDVRLLRCRQAFTACGPESHHYPSRDVVQQTLGEGFFIE